MEECQRRVAENPYDEGNWRRLVDTVKSNGDGEEMVGRLREIYGNLVTIFPTAVRAVTRGLGGGGIPVPAALWRHSVLCSGDAAEYDDNGGGGDGHVCRRNTGESIVNWK